MNKHRLTVLGGMVLTAAMSRLIPHPRYVAAVPFFRNTVAGDLMYSGLLFGVLLLAEKRWPSLAEPAATAVA
jgi:Family of unknown function (DUF6580)